MLLDGLIGCVLASIVSSMPTIVTVGMDEYCGILRASYPRVPGWASPGLMRRVGGIGGERFVLIS